MDFHSHIYKKLDAFIVNNQLPHLIFHGKQHHYNVSVISYLIDKIYGFDRQMKRDNVMSVDCSYGKGIKFIRDDLKMFAKSNVSYNNKFSFNIFKTIILYNADYLTMDAQSALRRCIELFSHNTRFILVVENKYKLLNPILSRFCEIYIPEKDYSKLNMEEMDISWHDEIQFINIIQLEMEKMRQNMLENKTEFTHADMISLINTFINNGVCCFHIIKWIKQNTTINIVKKSSIYMYFDKVRAEFRNEKLLMLQLLNHIFFVQKIV